MWPFRGRDEKRLAQPNRGGSPEIALCSSSDLKAWKAERCLVEPFEHPQD